MNELHDIKSHYNNFVSGDRIQQFEMKMRDFVPFTDFLDLTNNMRIYAKVEDLNHTKELVETIRNHFLLYTSK